MACSNDTRSARSFIVLFVFFVLNLYGERTCAQPSEAVNLTTSSGVIHGTLTMAKEGNGTVALIICGSGPTDRDGNVFFMRNNCMKMLADSLASHGIASVRYDKRGIAASKEAMIAEENLRFDDYVADACSWVAKLSSDVRFKRVVVIGHSEGALIGMLVARRTKASAYVSLAGVSESADNVLRRQLIAAPGGFADIAFPIIDSLNLGVKVSNVPAKLMSIFRPSVQPYLMSWFRVDPIASIRELEIPVLIVQGTNDVQVLEADARALKLARPSSTLVIIPEMNHVLKTAPKDRAENMKTYSNPELPLAPGLVSSIVSFLTK